MQDALQGWLFRMALSRDKDSKMTTQEAKRLYAYGKEMQTLHRKMVTAQENIKAKKKDLKGPALKAFNTLNAPMNTITDGLGAFLGSLVYEFDLHKEM